MKLGEAIFKISASCAKEEVFNLISQARSSSDFITLNIAKGSILKSNPELEDF